jgi:ankyrin repeat protein
MRCVICAQYGQTPLLYAAGHGHASVVKVLVELGADVNAKDGVVRRALTVVDARPIAAAAATPARAYFGPLLRADAFARSLCHVRCVTRTQAGTTALQIAANKGHDDVVKLLEELGSGASRT